MKIGFTGRLIVSIGAMLALPALVSAQQVSADLLKGMVWRNIGPFRGGRVSAVTGVIGQPGVFYMGLPMGGVWKTTGAGTTWYPIFDSIKEASSVGAIECAPSDPKTLYVGMGDMVVGGSVARGNGVYKSTDAGATWQHIGLERTEHIPSIIIDPKDPNLVMVAALGDNRAKSDARGIFRSADGGTTWTKTLNVDDEIGVQKIARAFDRPNVLLATTIRSYNPPGQGRGGGFGGGGGTGTTRLYKSTDEGLTWKQLTGGCLPSLAGKTSVAIAMNTDAQRMFVVGNFGLYRSDDGGATWRQMAANDRRVANGQGGYNCGVYVDSQNPDIVYVINTCLYRSTDGGKTFAGFKGAPGGDDPQQMWIDPTDGKRIFLGMDQGATVSLDGGYTWSLWYNQPTGQIYHVATDNQFPYWVYGTEQDSGAIATASRGNLGEITPLDWTPHPGWEWGHIIADPLNPKISYASSDAAGILKVTSPSGQWVNVSPSQDSSLGLRSNRQHPVIFSPTNPRELLAGFQCVMATTDGGMHWRKLSPDLTKAPDAKSVTKGVKQGGEGGTQTVPPDADEDEEDEGQVFAPANSMTALSASSVDGGVIWAGTNNGRIAVTKDHGGAYDEIVIPDAPARAEVSVIDASHHEAGTAYVALDAHNAGDLKPYLYRTRDYGRTWQKITAGLPEGEVGGSFTRVIRADTKRKGLLFAGTESSVYVSFDDGDHWQSLALNLPNTSYRDLVVKDNDLVVATFGRGFWILDDISPLRELAPDSSEPAHLFKPADAVRVRRNVGNDTPFPPEVPHAANPPLGAVIYYTLGTTPASEITLEVRDSKGQLVRHMSSASIPPLNEPPPPNPDFWLEKPRPLPKAAGLNRTNWNLRYDSPPAFSHSYEINANPGGTPPSPEGPLVAPGIYTVTLTVDGRSYSEKMTVRNDPRSPASASDLAAQHAAEMKLYGCVKEAWDIYHRIAEARSSIAATLTGNPADEVAKAARALDEKLAGLAGSAVGRRFGGGGFGGGAPAQPTFSMLHGQALRQLGTLETGDIAPTEAMRTACMATCTQVEKLKKTWQSLQQKELAEFQAKAKSR